AIADLDAPVARQEEAELADHGDVGVMRDALRRGRRPDRATRRVHLLIDGVVVPEELSAPAARRFHAGPYARGLRVGLSHLVEHEALAHVEHAEHVARVVDALVGMTGALGD